MPPRQRNPNPNPNLTQAPATAPVVLQQQPDLNRANLMRHASFAAAVIFVVINTAVNRGLIRPKTSEQFVLLIMGLVGLAGIGIYCHMAEQGARQPILNAVPRGGNNNVVIALPPRQENHAANKIFRIRLALLVAALVLVHLVTSRTLKIKGQAQWAMLFFTCGVLFVGSKVLSGVHGELLRAPLLYRGNVIVNNNNAGNNNAVNNNAGANDNNPQHANANNAAPGINNGR